MKQTIQNPALRAISAALALLQVLGSTPVLASQSVSDKSSPSPPPEERAGERRPFDHAPSQQPRPVSLTSKPAPLNFSAQPTDAEFFSANLFAVPLCAVGRTSLEENRALAEALLAYAQRTEPDDSSALSQFLDHFPQSPWKPALLV